MQATSARTARLAMQLLSLTRLDNPEHHPERSPLDLEHLAREAVRRHWSECHGHGVDLGMAGTGQPVMIRGIEWELEEALTNLIDNARCYGARRITVRVGGTPPVLAVEDDGPGIPESQRRLVLRPFHRGREEGEGSGLGLAIVDGIARAHDARLTLADGPDGRGLSVSLHFPEAAP